MKNKIWIFGDSFSTPFETHDLGPFATNYIKWKGYTPNTFGKILGERLGLEVIHFTKGGADNDTIFEWVYTSAPKIQKGDIVIIGWSSVVRFRLANQQNIFSSIVPNFNICDTLSFISPTTIDEVLVNRSQPIYLTELQNRVTFLNWLFEDMKLIQWCPFLTMIPSRLYVPMDISNINEETKGEMVDFHYSELGHNQLSEIFLALLKDDKVRRETNTPSHKLL